MGHAPAGLDPGTAETVRCGDAPGSFPGRQFGRIVPPVIEDLQGIR
jgi:hypothetical protein